jgi:hypothetical protein
MMLSNRFSFSAEESYDEVIVDSFGDWHTFLSVGSFDDALVCGCRDNVWQLFPLAFWGLIPMFDSNVAVVADLGKFFTAFFVYIFSAKCFSLILVSDMFRLFSIGCFVCDLLHVYRALQCIVVKGKVVHVYYQ